MFHSESRHTFVARHKCNSTLSVLITLAKTKEMTMPVLKRLLQPGPKSNSSNDLVKLNGPVHNWPTRNAMKVIAFAHGINHHRGTFPLFISNQRFGVFAIAISWTGTDKICSHHGPSCLVRSCCFVCHPLTPDDLKIGREQAWLPYLETPCTTGSPKFLDSRIHNETSGPGVDDQLRFPWQMRKIQLVWTEWFSQSVKRKYGYANIKTYRELD